MELSRGRSVCLVALLFALVAGGAVAQQDGAQAWVPDEVYWCVSLGRAF